MRPAAPGPSGMTVTRDPGAGGPGLCGTTRQALTGHRLVSHRRPGVASLLALFNQVAQDVDTAAAPRGRPRKSDAPAGGRQDGWGGRRPGERWGQTKFWSARGQGEVPARGGPGGIRRATLSLRGSLGDTVPAAQRMTGTEKLCGPGAQPALRPLAGGRHLVEDDAGPPGSREWALCVHPPCLNSHTREQTL